MPSVSDLFVIPDTSLLLVGEYNPSLVLVSVAIAIFASFMGFQVASQAASAKTRRGRRGLLAVGAFAQGSGIWSMHFFSCFQVNKSIQNTLPHEQKSLLNFCT